MLWEIELRPTGRDSERERVCDEFDLLTHSQRGADLVSASARGFLLEGPLSRDEVMRLCNELLVDPLVESCTVRELGAERDGHSCTVLLKPGVMDPVSQSVRKAARDIGVSVEEVRTFRRYFGKSDSSTADQELLFRKVLANEAIEQVVVGPLHADHLALGRPYA